MNVTTHQSANQLWKRELAQGLTHGNTKADFKNWLRRKKATGFSNATGSTDVPVNTALNSSIQDAINDLHTAGGLQTAANTSYIFGIPKTALVWSAVAVGVLVTGLIVYKIIHRK